VGEALGNYLRKVSGREVEDLVRDRDWERYLRDFRRLNTGNIQIMSDGHREIRGPYVQEAREAWLRALLTAQSAVRELGPDEVDGIELITFPELEEIRRIWVVDKHELEDRLPVIYQEILGEPYPGKPLDDNIVFGTEEMNELSEACGENPLHYQLTRELLGLTIQQRNHARRSGLFEKIEKAFRRSSFESEEEALERARDLAAEHKSLTNQNTDLTI
jgi:DNA sulfur modification protein DndC